MGTRSREDIEEELVGLRELARKDGNTIRELLIEQEKMKEEIDRLKLFNDLLIEKVKG